MINGHDNIVSWIYKQYVGNVSKKIRVYLKAHFYVK